MNLQEIFKKQIILDQAIEKAHQLEKKELRTKRIVALIIEVAEFANEYAPFKYWKKNINLKREAVIEEFVDGLHFFTSLALELKLDPIIEPIISSKDQTEQLKATFIAINVLFKDFTISTLKKAFALYLGNAKLLKISEHEIHAHYINKNNINHQRIKNNY